MEINWEASHGRELVQRGTNVTVLLLFHMSGYQQQPLRIFLVMCSLETEQTDLPPYPELSEN